MKIAKNSNLENLKSWCCNLEVLKSWLVLSWFKISRLQDQDFKISSFRESWICNPRVYPSFYKVHTKLLRKKKDWFHFFTQIWLQKCKHLVCKSQSKLSSSIPIGSYVLNVYIFDVKFLQKNWNSLIFDSWLFGMDFKFFRLIFVFLDISYFIKFSR